jgi:hypothetical protein
MTLTFTVKVVQTQATTLRVTRQLAFTVRA